jgi:recyclin-1
MTGPRSNDNVIASLRATQINVTSKPLLPAELIATILDYLPVPDLAQCARVSRRLQEMVYDDTRWIQKLKAMGVWSDAEARQRFEEGRVGRPEDVAESYLYCMRDGNVTGSVVSTNGGHLVM